MKRRRYRRRNPADAYAPILVGVGVVALLAVGYVVLSSQSASAATPNSFGPAQFSGGGLGAQVEPGTYVSLRDMPSGTNVLVQVGGVSGGMATGTVAYAPSAANESVGDTVSFNLSDAVASSIAPFAP